MKYTSLDSIIKSVLLKKSYPLHFYVRYMVSARDIVQTLIFDDGLLPPNTILLQVDENGDAPLPKDFIKDISVGIRVGEYIRPLVKKDTLNRLPNRDSLGNIEPFHVNSENYILESYMPTMQYTTSYFNEYGEFLGRMNIGAGIEKDVYTIVPERCVIHFTEFLAGQNAILTYISDGSCRCSTLGIDPMAKEVIEAYMAYDRIRHSRNPALSEMQLAENKYIQQRKIYRARKNKLGIEEIRRIFIRAYYAAPK